MYDIIGDIHGHADELRELLRLLGYRRDGAVYAHPSRRAIFVGDFIDRGPRIREVLAIVRPMVECGKALAVMGNHEFNALSYHTRDLSAPGEFLRRHSAKNRLQHRATLEQLPADELRDHLEWFRALPFRLELDGLRVVHASWDPEQNAVIDASLRAFGGVTSDFLVEANRAGSDLFPAIEDVIKGKEVPLPAGCTVPDTDGHFRDRMRTRWYASPRGLTFAEYALPSAGGFPAVPVPDRIVAAACPYGTEEPPVIFGHYWLRSDRPARLAPNVACVDFSVAKGGFLCAYRWDGERELSDASFVPVAAREHAAPA